MWDDAQQSLKDLDRRPRTVANATNPGQPASVSKVLNADTGLRNSSVNG